MSIFADKGECVWKENLPQDIVNGYVQDNRKYITDSHDCLRVILTRRLPQQMSWLKLWMKCGGVLDTLWISPVSTASNISVLSVMEILNELALNDETLDFLSRLRSLFECLWLRYSKEIAKNVLTTMKPKTREALLMANFEGPSGDAEAHPLVYHAIQLNRTQLAQFLLLSDHGKNDAIFRLVIRKNKSHWIAWYLRNELSNKTIAVDYLVKHNNIGELRKIMPTDSEKWLKQLHSSIETAVVNSAAESLEWLLENGADPNCISMTQCSPELLAMFLKFGADPNLYALDFYDKECWKTLLEHGARAVLSEHIIEEWVIVINKIYDGNKVEVTPEIHKRLTVLFQNLSNVLGPCDTTQKLYNNIEKLLKLHKEKKDNN